MKLLDYLDQLEAAAKAAPGGRWARPVRCPFGEIVSDEQPFDEGYGGKLICESVAPLAAAYIVAMQPNATLALIAKLRELLAKFGPLDCSRLEIEVPQ